MAKPTHIAHPLKSRRGTSQRTRRIEALKPETAPIDGRDLADMLSLISQYALQINFYEYAKSAEGQDYQELHSWSDFFSDSLPFQLASLSKTNTLELEEQYLLLYNELVANPSQQALDALLNFFLDQIILPVSILFKRVSLVKNSFMISLRSIIESSFKEPLKCYMAISNASATFLCTCKQNFTEYLEDPWRIKVQDIYALDTCIQQTRKGKKAAFLIAANTLNDLFYKMLNAVNEIVETAPDYIHESLWPLEEEFQQKHQPHLALLFTFLELFKHFQGNINSLTKKHLDFFYKEVLKMVPKKEIEDKAHIVFEIAKHLDVYPLPEGLLLKNGKDVNNEDIQFGLDHEIIIDKAQIKDLKTLMLNKTSIGDECYLEGVYMASTANSKDGLGMEFKEEDDKSWYTLGNKESKLSDDGKIQQEPDDNGKLCNEVKEPMIQHPDARLGFALASPVLYLLEGKRKISIQLDCSLKSDPLNLEKTCPEKEFTLSEIISKFSAISSPVTAYVFTFTELQSELSGFTLTDQAERYIASNFDKPSKNIFFHSQLNSFINKRVKPGVFVLRPAERVKIKDSIKKFEVQTSRLHTSIFNFYFSGKEEWLAPEDSAVKIHVWEENDNSSSPKILFDISIDLESDFPSIDFYNKEVLEEKIKLEQTFPVVKILLKEIKLDCDKEEEIKDPCCLKKSLSLSNFKISVYHYFKRLQLDDATINVEVCGVRNLIVQNDENLQDVNKPIMPFGPRPKVGEDWFTEGGANFYVGSKEIFCKNWQELWVNTTWKDKPKSLEEHYKFYDLEPFEDNSTTIKNESFRFLTSFLENGVWRQDLTTKLPDESPPPNTPPHRELLRLFESYNETGNFCAKSLKQNTFCHGIGNTAPAGVYKPKSLNQEELEPLNISSDKGFMRITLAGVSFQHDRYTYVLASQMMKLSNLLSPKEYEQLRERATQAKILSDTNAIKIGDAKSAGNATDIVNEIEKEPIIQIPPNILNASSIPNSYSSFGLEIVDKNLNIRVTDINDALNINSEELPNEPYTPIIKSLSIDYKASANKNDIDIIHLYPFESTSKQEDILANPTLFPFFDDEGTLFIGLENLTPGGQLSILFQLAETTADSETDRADIKWQYLSENNWKNLRTGFEVISDDTDGLTVSGIVTIALPDDIKNTDNTIMPENLYWIKVYAPENIKAVAQTFGIHTQAALSSARISPLNSTDRLEEKLPEGSIAKLVSGDFSVKKVNQPYVSFGGRKPEKSGHFYVRVSEHLKHKGRALTCTDYEKIVLEHFPEIYKVKSISHSMGLSAHKYERDLEVAPGYTIITVIPDLTKLGGGSQLEPKVPVSLLEKITKELKKRTSPFARFKVMNPRYEYIDVSIKVRLYRGKPINFYRKKLIEDITFFLAPWHLGDSEKLSFGQDVVFSDVVGFVESLDYVEFITDLRLTMNRNDEKCNQSGSVITPLTARSILTGGEICVTIDEEDCPEPENSVTEEREKPVIQ